MRFLDIHHPITSKSEQLHAFFSTSAYCVLVIIDNFEMLITIIITKHDFQHKILCCIKKLPFLAHDKEQKIKCSEKNWQLIKSFELRRTLMLRNLLKKNFMTL